MFALVRSRKLSAELRDAANTPLGTVPVSKSPTVAYVPSQAYTMINLQPPLIDSKRYGTGTNLDFVPAPMTRPH